MVDVTDGSDVDVNLLHVQVLPGRNEQPNGCAAPALNRFCDLFSTTSETRALEPRIAERQGWDTREARAGSPCSSSDRQLARSRQRTREPGRATSHFLAPVLARRRPSSISDVNDVRAAADRQFMPSRASCRQPVTLFSHLTRRFGKLVQWPIDTESRTSLKQSTVPWPACSAAGSKNRDINF